MNINLEKFFADQEKKEAERKKMLSEQISKGCEKCSQWDDYFGCCKCESL